MGGLEGLRVGAQHQIMSPKYAKTVEFIQGQKGDLLSQVSCKTGEERKLKMWLEEKCLSGSVVPSPEPSAMSMRRDSSCGSCYSETWFR